MFLNKVLSFFYDPYSLYLRLIIKIKKNYMNWRFDSYDDIFKYEVTQDFIYTKLKAKLLLDHDINLEDPKKFSEKLIHRRLFSRDPIWPIVTDKIAVRAWLEEKKYLDVVRLVPARVVYSVEELMLIHIDKPVVIKAAWASGMNLFINSNSQLASHKATLEKWMKSPYAIERLIWAPEKMKRGFLVENSIANKNGRVPVDFKFHCFDGLVHFFHIDIDRFESHKRLVFSRDGERVDWCYGKSQYEGVYHVNSDVVAKMVAAAEKISNNFSYVRIDLYEYEGDIYFGEITQTQGAGFEKFTNPDLDRYYGDIWNYPNNIVMDLNVQEKK